MLLYYLERTLSNRKKLEILVRLLKQIGKLFVTVNSIVSFIILICTYFRYELIIKPSIPKSNDSNQSGSFVIYEGDKVSLTPKLLKTRKEAFYRALLERTKDCHEVGMLMIHSP